MWSEAKQYLETAAGVAAFQLSKRPEDCYEAVRRQRSRREANFLTLAEYALGTPGHIYQRLFAWAGCELGDLRTQVARDGLELTLRGLLAAGVYITNAEFRGREEIVRGGKQFPVESGGFVNPVGRGRIKTFTSGSGGKRFQVEKGLALVRHVEGYYGLNIEEFGLKDRECVLLGSILPSSWPLVHLARHRRLGAPISKWFAPAVDGGKGHAYKAITRFICAQAFAIGSPIPFPEFLGDDGFLPVARYLAAARRRRPVHVRSSVSFAARTARAALDAGMDISGTIFNVSGEPLTDGKREVIEAAGAVMIAQYHAAELSAIGFGCHAMRDGNRVHLIDDTNCLFTASPDNTGRGTLYATNAATFTPNILINLEMDDTVTILPARCGCVFSRAGFTTEVRDIFSYSKVTGQGMTVQAQDLMALLEERMPRRFGGIAGDYQLSEEEAGSQTQMVLRVSPRTGARDIAALREHFFSELRTLYGGHLSARVWSYTDGFSIRLEEPVATPTGKVPSIRFIGEANRVREKTNVV